MSLAAPTRLSAENIEPQAKSGQLTFTCGIEEVTVSNGQSTNCCDDEVGPGSQDCFRA